MLGKLFKYEFKSTARYMLPMYLFIIVLAFINMFFVGDIVSAVRGGVLYNSIKIVVFMLYYIAVVALFIVTLLVVAGKFYKNLLGNEGYISLTLPVSIDQHIAVKLITGFVWMFLSTVILLFSLFIVSAGAFNIVTAFDEISSGYRLLRSTMGQSGLNLDVYVLTVVLIMICGTFASLLQIYFAMSIGQLAAKHKIGMSFLAYFVIAVILQFVSTVLVSSTIGMTREISGAVDGLKLLLRYEFIMLVWQLMLSVGFYFGTRYILKNRINLQ